MKTPHKHAELIKQWADGAQIQWYNNVTDKWEETSRVSSPCWDSTTKYRVKPKDVVKYQFVTDVSSQLCIGPDAKSIANLMLVFDGETGALKDCQVLAKE